MSERITHYIPVKVSKVDNFLRCTIPKKNAETLGIGTGDSSIWTLRSNGTLEARLKKKITRERK